MDAFAIGIEQAKRIRDKYEADIDINVCDPAEVPEGDKLIESGITLLRQQDPARKGELLEIRGYDEEGKPFSCKFRMHKGQSLMMRAVNGFGDIKRFAVELINEDDERRAPYKLRDSHRIFPMEDKDLLAEITEWLAKLDDGHVPTDNEEVRLRVLSKELRARLADGYMSGCRPRAYRRKY